MDAGGSMHEWYRFLDARSDDEAVCELMRHTAKLEVVYDDLVKACRGLNYSPGGDVDAALAVTRATLGEAIEMLDGVVRRFRAGEHEMA
jgi:hypothetical protein